MMQTGQQISIDTAIGGFIAACVFLITEPGLKWLGLFLGVLLLVLRIILTIKELRDRKNRRNRRAGDKKNAATDRRAG